MTGRPDLSAAERLAGALAAAEPDGPRPLAGLVQRLDRDGDLRAVLGPAGAQDVTAGTGLTAAGISDDSRTTLQGQIFVAIPGAHTDGHQHVAQALAMGAIAAIVERPLPGLGGVQVVVDRSPRALASAAAWWYGDPSRELAVVGVTGTDGKTTTSFLVAAALEAAGQSTGLVGTVETRVGPIHARTPGHVTTPGAIALQRLLRAMVVAGDRAVVIETTSHGLAAERVGAVAYDAAILTNLSHEHLEFHGTFEAYRAAKLSLFERLGSADHTRLEKADQQPRLGIVNADDPAATLFGAATKAAGARLLTYGTRPAVDVRADALDERPGSLRFDVTAAAWTGHPSLRLAGRFNVHNALAAIALGVGWGLDLDAIVAGVESVERVPGRMERVDAGQPFGVVVDFAHSPAALQGVLDELGPTAAAAGGGLIAVFGSAGERDTAKRPMMGRIAAERCRLVVVTDEDPRGEDRQIILDQIAAGAEVAGARPGSGLLIIPDRATAIAAALEQARAGDIVVLAGKGHEPTIEGPDGPVPWDERRAAEDALTALGFGPTG